MGIWLSWKKTNCFNFCIHVLSLLCFSNFNVASGLQLLGFRQGNGSFTPDGIPLIYAEHNNTLRFFGVDVNASLAKIVLVEEPLTYGQLCDDQKDSDPFEIYNATENSGLVNIIFSVTEKKKFYFCVKYGDPTLTRYIHQGTAKWLSIVIEPPPPEPPGSLLPLPLQILIISVLLLLSGIFSGLNLGLMSLDPMELQIIMKSGTKAEQKFSSIIYPIRKKGNFLLCTLLLGNVLVNNTLTILLGDLTTGVWAIVGSTAAIVIFGEIVPQALCSRYGLHVGAYTIWLTKIFMVITFVVSYPISKILDIILGKEIGTVYNRKKLLEMLKVTDPYNDLAKDEVNIIQGALELRTKTVQEVMTPIADCFMVDISSVLDFETVREIMSTGYTRIPVFDKEKTNVMSLLFVKDLAFIDPDDCTPLRTLCKYYKHPLNFVFNDITLDKLLEEFKTGTFHMAIVQKVNNEGPGDPFYEVVGIITLEDVIEEIIKSEIVDETDVYTDNRKQQLNEMRQKTPVDLSLFVEQPGEGRKPVVTPQILLAAHRFLLAEVEPFKLIADKVLLRLLKQDVVMELSFDESDPKSEKMLIYHKNKPSDYFVLVLEGQVNVIVGRENLEFQGGPFSCYGVPALLAPSAPPSSILPPKQSHTRANSLSRVSHAATSHDSHADSLLPPQHGSAVSAAASDVSIGHSQPFLPDYDLIATSDVKYLKITRKQFLNAVRATKMAEDGSITDDGNTSPHESPLIRIQSKKSVVSAHIISSSSNNNNAFDDMEPEPKDSEYSISQSHPDLAPPRKPAPHLRYQNKSMSSGQLMAMAAKYATVHGDRVHHTPMLRSLANSDRGGLYKVESGPSKDEDGKEDEAAADVNNGQTKENEHNPDKDRATVNNERTTLLNSL